MFKWLESLAYAAVIRGVNRAFRKIAESVVETEDEDAPSLELQEPQLLVVRRPKK